MMVVVKNMVYINGGSSAGVVTKMVTAKVVVVVFTVVLGVLVEMVFLQSNISLFSS